MRSATRWAIFGMLAAGAVWAQAPVVTHNATEPVRAGDVIAVVATGQANATATFQIQGQTRTWPMVETPDGHYSAEYTVRRNDDVNDKAITVFLRLADKRVLTGVSANAIGKTLPAPANSSEVVVQKIDVAPKTWVRGGTTVTITVDATPQCTVTATAAGLFSGVPLAERDAGHYVGTWYVLNRADLCVSQPTFFLRLRKNGRSTVVPVDEFLGVDNVAPLILATVPFDGEPAVLGPETVAVAYDDTGGSDLDLAKCQIVLDGTNIMAGARQQRGWVTCHLSKAMEPGRHQLSVTLVDKAGNRSNEMITHFGLVGTVATPAAPEVTVTHNATRALEPGDTLTVTMAGPAGGKATFSIGTLVENRPMTEVKPGQYQADYVVRRTDKLADQPITVDLETGGRHIKARAAAVLPGATTTTKAPTLVAPTFTAPLNGATLTGATALRGTATAGAKVEITIDSLALVAGFMETRGNTVKLTATVNADGTWATAPFAFERPALAGKTTFTIVAVTVQGDKRSDATTIKVDR